MLIIDIMNYFPIFKLNLKCIIHLNLICIADIKENFRDKISPMGYFPFFFQKKIFTNFHFLKPPLAQVLWGKVILL